MVLCRAYQPPQRRPMDLAPHHLPNDDDDDDDDDGIDTR